MLAPHHQSPPSSIAEALVAGSDVCLAKLEGGAVADMSRDRCSAILGAKPRKHGTMGLWEYHPLRARGRHRGCRQPARRRRFA